ncbi:DUF202 domain-containing protein [Kribbella turkmenica]|uniref:DUF202 domain-containing protein n=1 Tax=Kribbella turkmenica TaxID=2530375 RepID=A0A4R4X484_9ACTN|nr:DUF202 domain-containing protein [Kribbella turkmenica]TDD25025.1 DUF202 domain-containing protein [Kribbella turkmenica]
MTPNDPGLQPERTLLAWRRTALGLIANSVLLLASGHGTSDVRTGLGIVVLVLSLACWGAVSAVYRRTKGAPVHALGHDRLLRAAAGLVLVVGLFDLYAVVTR